MAGARGKTKMKILKIIFTLLLFQLPNISMAQSYDTGCLTADNDDVMNMQLDIINQKFSFTATAYEDNDCHLPYIIFKNEYITNSTTADSITLSHTASSYTPLTDEVASALNYIQYCGFIDWKKDSVKTVTGLVCDDYTQLKEDEKVTKKFHQTKDYIEFDSYPKFYLNPTVVFMQ